MGALLGGGVAQLLGLVAPFWFAFVVMAVFTALAWRRLGQVAYKVGAGTPERE